jgi:signal transduction histidine kinase
VQGLPTLTADPVQMRQLLQNLLQNALKFVRPEEPPRIALTSPDYARDFVAKARFPKRIADAPGAAQRGALPVRRSEQRGRKTRGARKTSLQQKES